jgi:ring-1,2-phenylacetyl-CoA epoxidase subunit PaaC
MTQDELGHARSLYAALESVSDSPEAYLKEGQREHLQGLPVLEKPFEHWAQFVAAAVLLDRALTVVFEAAGSSTYEPLRQRAAKILQEEWFHRQYGEGWLRKLAAEPRTRAGMQAAVSEFWQPTADWLAAADGAGTEGVLAESGEALRARWTNETTALLAECGLVAP